MQPTICTQCLMTPDDAAGGACDALAGPSHNFRPARRALYTHLALIKRNVDSGYNTGWQTWGPKLYTLVCAQRDATPPPPAAATPTDPLDPNTPINVVDADLRAIGVDPDALAARGLAFVREVKAEMASRPDAKALQDICNEAFGEAIRIATALNLSGADAGAMGRDAENSALYNAGYSRGAADQKARGVALLGKLAAKHREQAGYHNSAGDDDWARDEDKAAEALEEAAAALAADGGEVR